jgi:hypothetical protein
VVCGDLAGVALWLAGATVVIDDQVGRRGRPWAAAALGLVRAGQVREKGERGVGLALGWCWAEKGEMVG